MKEKKLVVTTPVGALTLEGDDHAVYRLHFGGAESEGTGASPSPVLKEAARQLQEYFAGKRKHFSVPLHPQPGSEFQARVRQALLRIRFGETRTYGELARELGTSPRAIGGACARNEIPILVPCHRVVAKSGLGGFSGEWETGLAKSVKAKLLGLENENSAPDPA